MNLKKYIILIILTIFLFSIVSVSASDTNETLMTSIDDSPVELSQNNKEIISQNEHEDIINDMNDATFADLQDKINKGYHSTITLDKNYTYEGTGYPNGINIS